MDLTVGQCHLCVYLDSLPAVAQAEWKVALAKPVTMVGNTAIVEYLDESQMYTTEASVRRHRKNHVV